MTMKTREELIKAYIDFFKEKKHKHIPSSSLIPENDPTVLFTTAGMHPLVPFLLGQKHPSGKRLVNVQKCIRTGDIDEVGDKSHGTFFEMLGNWSLGDYWKDEAIQFTFEYLTKVIKFRKDNIAVSVFAGDDKIGVEEDKESLKKWKSLGIADERIAHLGKEDNWWGPAGETGPCGPCTEVFYWTGKDKAPKKYDPNNENWLEVGNDVFMEYNKTKSGSYEKLKQRNVDFGGGLIRQLAIINGLDDIFKTSVFSPIIREIERISGKKYIEEGKASGKLGSLSKETRAMRIIADHIKASVFILGDEKGIKPSNVGQGYVLRRLIRRAIRYARLLGIKENFAHRLTNIIAKIYPDYQEIERNHKIIEQELKTEEEKFNLTLEKGLKKFKELEKDKIISGKEAFLLFQSYGFPIEFTEELADESGVKVDLEEYNDEFKRHQDLSRTASAGMFKSGLADDSEATKKLHTATHLLNEALRIVLQDKEIKQKGSNINPERLRFDFNFPRKLTEEEVKQVEKLINEKIKANLQVIREEIPLEDAINSGAQHEFGTKYPELVSIYTIADKKDKRGWFSKEFCTGPHVSSTKELGSFKIIKEESSSAGIRRIKAVVE